MAERQPAIEQKSRFTSKTKQGQDVEFEAILKFYVSPTGEVTITAPGASPTGSGETPRGPDYQGDVLVGQSSATLRQPSSQSDIPPSEPVAPPKQPTGPPPPSKPDTSSSQHIDTPLPPPKPQQKAPPERPKEKDYGGKVEIPRDDSLDRAFPHGPKVDCPITQFIPDPCRAIDDLQKSVKNILANFFSSRDHPPPQNTASSLADSPIIERNQDSKAESEAMKNEEKYDM